MYSMNAVNITQKIYKGVKKGFVIAADFVRDQKLI